MISTFKLYLVHFLFGEHSMSCKGDDIFRCFLRLIFLRQCSLARLLLLGGFSDREFSHALYLSQPSAALALQAL